MAVRRTTRLTRTQDKEAKKALVRYIALTIGIIAFIALVGVPLLIPRLTQFIDETTGRNAGFDASDNTPPPPPNLRDVPQFTKEESIDISGYTEPGAKVFVVVNSKDTEIIADLQGNFSTKIELGDEENEVYAFAEDNSGNKSADSSRYIVRVDKEVPELTIIKPQDGAIQFGQDNHVQIEGQTEADVSVRINDRVAIVNREGKFNSRFSLNEGSNSFDVIATDRAGNETKISLTVSYTP